MSLAHRSPFKVFFCVTIALLFRELKTHFGEYRLGYLWTIGEPTMHVVVVSLLLSSEGRGLLYDIDFPTFVLTGCVAFDFMTNSVIHSVGAIEANQGLFVYKQVKPFDVVFTRTLLEWLLHMTAFLVILSGLAMLGYDVHPHDPLALLCISVIIFFTALGCGLITATIGELQKDLRRVIPYGVRPLYFVSCVFFPLHVIPPEHRWILLLNPLTHIHELIRTAWFASYPEAGASYTFLIGFTLGSLAIGTVMYRRFRYQLVTQ